MDLLRYQRLGLAPLIGSLFLLLPVSGANADDLTPLQIPPSQECIDLAAQDMPLYYSKWLYNQKKTNAAWQEVVDAGCLTKNNLTNPIRDYLDLDTCERLEAPIGGYLNTTTSWAAPLWKRYKRVNRQAGRQLNPLRNKLLKALNLKKGAQVRRLLAKERRLIAKFRPQFVKIGRQSVGRAPQIAGSVALIQGELHNRGCETSPEFWERQHTFFTVLYSSMLVWLKEYTGKITNDDWFTWQSLNFVSHWDSAVDMTPTTR